MYKLLIVDDEPIIRRGIKSLANLADMGISEIYEAESGQEAIDLAKEVQPHIILMDINMPEVDGLTAAAHIKKDNPDIFVIILTGYDYFEYAQTAIRAKVDDYVLKPVSKKDIELIFFKTVDLLERRYRQSELEKVSGNLAEEGSDISADYGDDLKAKINDYLRDNIFLQELSLAAMSEELGFNSSYLSVSFKQIFGIPFQDYVNRKRMERAKLLLLSTGMKNYEIAEAVGIEDVNYFVTKFKKAFGVTPKQYRQGVQRNEPETDTIKD